MEVREVHKGTDETGRPVKIYSGNVTGGKTCRAPVIALEIAMRFKSLIHL